MLLSCLLSPSQCESNSGKLGDGILKSEIDISTRIFPLRHTTTTSRSHSYRETELLLYKWPQVWDHVFRRKPKNVEQTSSVEIRRVAFLLGRP
jgi:hypothetical protein